MPPGVDVVPTRVTPSVLRLLDRVSDTPVAVYDAAWTPIIANPAYDALMGDTCSWRGIERNAIWRNLLGPDSRVLHTAAELADLQAQQVAGLRLTAARYPADRTLVQLIGRLSAQSPRFRELWGGGAPELRSGTSRLKTIEHPSVGHVTLDCDVLVIAADDLRVMIYTVEPGTEDAERLAFVTVLGTQALTEQPSSRRPIL